MGAVTAAIPSAAEVEPRPVPWRVKATPRPAAMGRIGLTVLIEDPTSVVPSVP